MDPDKDLIDALVYASYQIPRLLFIAHSVWFDLRKRGTTTNREFYIQAFEAEAIKYYDEMVQILKEFTSEAIAHILLACGCIGLLIMKHQMFLAQKSRELR